MISDYNDNLMEEEARQHFSTPLLRLLEDDDTNSVRFSAPIALPSLDMNEDTTYFRKAQLDAIHTLQEKDDDSDVCSLFIPLEINHLASDDEDCWNFDSLCHQKRENFLAVTSPRTMSTGMSAPHPHPDSDLQFREFKFSDLANQISLASQQEPAEIQEEEIKIRQEEDVSDGEVEERVSSFSQKMKKSSQEAIYAKDELSKKILRHLTTYDRKKIRKMTPKSVRKLKARQLDYVRKYFWKEYELEEEIMQQIQRGQEATMITLFCSLDVRVTQQRRKMPEKEEVMDRKKLINGQKDTVIALLSSELGKRVYLKPFIKLWRRVVKSEIAGTGFEDDFYRYLEDIEAAVARV